MKKVNVNVLLAASNASANGVQIDSNQLVSASFQAFFGNGDEAGTFKVQASNDIDTTASYINGDFVVTNWTDIPSQTASISSGATALLTVTVCSYRWMRVVYTRSGGGAANKNTTVNMFALSV